MTLNEYQELAMVTAAPDLKRDELLFHALHGMASEVGEIHSFFQKRYQGHDVDKEHLKKELGDLMWFIAEFSKAAGWSLDEVGTQNIDKLKARYPEGFDAYHSLHRKEGDV